MHKIATPVPALAILSILCLDVTAAEGPVAPAEQVTKQGAAVNEITLRNDFQLAEIKANAGDPEAQILLSQLYSEGKGVGKSERKANYWLDKAARQGNRQAQVKLADRMYYKVGIPRPYYAHALKWYTLAAEQGDPYAMAMTGKMYYKGIGTKRDYKVAFTWLFEAAKLGDPESQHLVGVMYRFGHGMEKNYLNAYIWLHVAFESSKDVEERKSILKQRERVGKLMEESELLGAKLIAPEYADLYARRY
ncbi:MAG: sel1 repeat family protein [Gammaproteobacteria bacterium]|nr:sel1 repeat family protein [Gammaproteobacteria bacterium]